MICGRATVPGLLFLLPVGDSWFWLMSTGTCKLYSYDKLPGFSGCCYCFVATITEKNPCKRCTFLLKIWVQNWGLRLSMAWCNKPVISTTVLNILKVYLFVSNWCLPTELELVLYLGFKLGSAAYLCSYGLFVGFMANISKISKTSLSLLWKIPRFLVCAGVIGLFSMVTEVVICSQDIVTRFAHQSGYHVERRFGWDCHGLPVVWFNIVQEYILCL